MQAAGFALLRCLSRKEYVGVWRIQGLHSFDYLPTFPAWYVDARNRSAAARQRRPRTPFALWLLLCGTARPIAEAFRACHSPSRPSGWRIVVMDRGLEPGTTKDQNGT
jgi:hypothetical protein